MMGLISTVGKILELSLADHDLRDDHDYNGHGSRRRASSRSRSGTKLHRHDRDTSSIRSERRSRHEPQMLPHPNETHTFPSFGKTSELRAHIDDLRHDLARTQRKLSRARNRNEGRDRKIKELLDALAAKTRLCDSQSRIIEENEERLSTMQNTIRQLDTQFEEHRTVLQHEFNRELAATRTRHEIELSGLRDEMTRQGSRKDLVIRTLTGEKTALESRCDDMGRNWHAIKSAEDALLIAVQFQEQLAKNSYIRWRGPKSNALVPDDKKVFYCKMDRYASKVPLMAQFLPWSAAAKTCMICASDYHELDIASPEHWKQACCGFEGPWTKDILSFPDAEDLHCDHAMDVCKTCIQSQIHTQLETMGSKGWDKLSCPVCSRVLAFDEVRRFASAEDFTKYERFYLLEHLSKEPGFRWCLSGTCTSGQLYEQMRIIYPRISCEACSFVMCFRHQVPWHAGMTCEEFDRNLVHGAEEEQSEAWKKQNTKACPGAGCGRPILKGEGCFHMTCNQCRHEFCWECLADWHLVRTDRSRHNDGCYFLTSTVGPTGMRGATLAAAMERT